MTPFFAERDHYSREIRAFWLVRWESPAEIAARIQATARAVAEIEPAFGVLWPYTAARAIVPGKDPGPVLNMTEAELGDLIDRRCRFDKKPAAPKPPSEDGYSVTLANNRPSRDPLAFGLSVNAGRTTTKLYNTVAVGGAFWAGNTLWKDASLPQAVFEILVRCWEPDLGAVYAYISAARDASGHIPPGPVPRGRNRLWMYWTRPGVEPHKMYTEMEPAAESQPWLGGTLSVWP